MIERADFDHDGLVSEEEFYNLLTKKAFWFDACSSSLFIEFCLEVLIEKGLIQGIGVRLMNLDNIWVE
jgi:hypothetical protein